MFNTVLGTDLSFEIMSQLTGHIGSTIEQKAKIGPHAKKNIMSPSLATKLGLFIENDLTVILPVLKLGEDSYYDVVFTSKEYAKTDLVLGADFLQFCEMNYASESRVFTLTPSKQVELYARLKQPLTSCIKIEKDIPNKSSTSLELDNFHHKPISLVSKQLLTFLQTVPDIETVESLDKAFIPPSLLKECIISLFETHRITERQYAHLIKFAEIE